MINGINVFVGPVNSDEKTYERLQMVKEVFYSFLSATL